MGKNIFYLFIFPPEGRRVARPLRTLSLGAVWVAIEMGGTPLQDFVHPPRAVYVLGSEDNGLNRPIVEACQCHVALPKWTGRSSSYNVAMAGTLVMYDRMLKQLGAGHAKVQAPAARGELEELECDE